jgi:hypothetical protein
MGIHPIRWAEDAVDWLKSPDSQSKTVQQYAAGKRERARQAEIKRNTIAFGRAYDRARAPKLADLMADKHHHR